MCFEIRHGARCVSRRRIQLMSRSSETSCFHDSGKHPHVLEGIHLTPNLFQVMHHCLAFYDVKYIRSRKDASRLPVSITVAKIQTQAASASQICPVTALPLSRAHSIQAFERVFGCIDDHQSRS